MTSNPTTPPVEIISARITKMLTRSISTDGQGAQMVFEIAGKPDKLVLEIPVSGLAPLQSLVAEMRRQADRRNLKTGMMIRQQPQSFMVGHSDEQRGFTAIMFNEKTVDEQIFMLRDADAVKLAQAIMRDVASRGGPRHQGIIMPNGKILGAE